MRPCLIKIKKKTRYTVENSLGPISPAGYNQHTDKSYHQDRGHSVTARTTLCVSYAIVSFLVVHFYNLSAQRGHMLAQGDGSQHLSHKPETWVPFPWMASVIPALTEPASLESCSLEAEMREIQLCSKADGENPLPKTLASMYGPWTSMPSPMTM